MSRSAAAQSRNEARAKARAKAVLRKRLITAGIAVGVIAIAAVIGITIGGGGSSSTPMATPAGVTEAGGIIVGKDSAPVHVVAYEDPQCPVCRQFEEINGQTLHDAVLAGKVQVEYRMRSFIGVESVRAVNALAAAHVSGRFEALRESIFAHQPKERTGGYSTDDLLKLGADVGLTDPAFVDAVRTMKYKRWVAATDDRASRDGNNSTPEFRVDGQVLTQSQTFEPAAFRAALKL